MNLEITVGSIVVFTEHNPKYGWDVPPMKRHHSENVFALVQRITADRKVCVFLFSKKTGEKLTLGDDEYDWPFDADCLALAPISEALKWPLPVGARLPSSVVEGAYLTVTKREIALCPDIIKMGYSVESTTLMDRAAYPEISKYMRSCTMESAPDCVIFRGDFVVPKDAVEEVKCSASVDNVSRARDFSSARGKIRDVGRKTSKKEPSRFDRQRKFLEELR